MLTASSLDLEKVQLILNLEHVVNDNELETIPPVHMPPQSGKSKTSHIISHLANSIQQKLCPKLTVKLLPVNQKHLVLLPSPSFFLLAMSFYLISLMLSSYSVSGRRQREDMAL